MKSPRKRYSNKQRTITCTDEEWDADPGGCKPEGKVGVEVGRRCAR